jgi:uncharacterized protein YjbI with pentapeptide repeats
MENGDEAAAGDKAPAPTYDQAFFLALAAKGKDAWNKWRHDPANKGVYATFKGVDFSEAPKDKIDFSGFEFGGGANFSVCKWRGVEHGGEAFRPGRACFTCAVFGSGANFIGADFSSEAMFLGAALGGWANFNGAAFGIGTDFRDVIFGDRASFAGAAFGAWANFNGAAFGWRADFAGATFDGLALFMDVVFGDEANFVVSSFSSGAPFDHVHFQGSVEFTGKSQEQWTPEVQARLGWLDDEAGAPLKKRHEESWMRESSGPDRFLDIWFTNSRFDGETNFSGRAFERTADFTRARFYFPPVFDVGTKDARIVFAGAHIGFVPPGHFLHWTTDAKIPFRLRALRKIADETKNHDLQRDLYIEERNAERGVYWSQLLEELEVTPRWQKPLIIWRLFTHWLWIGVMGLYWVLAEYGRNFFVPAIWLGLSVPFFYWRYSKVLAPLMHEAGSANAEKYNHAVWMLAFGNAVPFVGPLTVDAEVKKFLFCPGFGSSLPMPPDGFQVWLVVHNVVSIILVFFIGLALRNYFKIK